MKSVKQVLSRLPRKDWITILGLLFVTITIGLYFFRRSTYVEVEIFLSHDNVFFSDSTPPYWYPEQIEVGAEEKDELGRSVARITAIKAYEGGRNAVDTYVRAEIRTVYNKQNKQYSFRGKPVLVGSPIVISPDKTMIKGIIVNVASQTFPDREVIVETRLRDWNYPQLDVLGVDPILGQAIDIGNVVRDLDNNMIAEVVDKQTLAGKRITNTAAGTPLLVNDPYFQDIRLKIKLRARISDGTPYFMNKYKVKVGNEIPLYFQQVTAFAQIIYIFEDQEMN